MKKIALFGTSADPPTSGHQVILEWLANHYDWVGVWASDNPYKNHQTDLEHRVAMLRLLIEEINLPRHNIKLDQKLSHLRSLISVQKAQEIWGKEQDYYLVIGSDLIAQIQKWYRIKDLLKEVTILIIPRPHYPIEPEEIQAIKNSGGNYIIADLNAPAVSSTAYRKEGDQNAIPTMVQDYIECQNLYL